LGELKPEEPSPVKTLGRCSTLLPEQR
jgi:hypothetical protein